MGAQVSAVRNSVGAGFSQKMKVNLLVQVVWGLHLAAAYPNSNKYESFLGCYRDDSSRDFKKGNINMGRHAINKCRVWAKKRKYKYSHCNGEVIALLATSMDGLETNIIRD